MHDGTTIWFTSGSAHSGQKDIDLRDFIQLQCDAYYGDGAFPCRSDRSGPRRSGRSSSALFVEERKKSVLDVSQIPSSITAHDAGYIDKDNEVIVGLQTEAPLKRAIMPNGGFRLVLNALKTYGYEPDPGGRRDLHQVPQDPQRRRVSTPTPRTSAAAAARTS